MDYILVVTQRKNFAIGLKNGKEISVVADHFHVSCRFYIFEDTKHNTIHSFRIKDCVFVKYKGKD